METSHQVGENAHERLDGLTPQQLVSEIRHISAQYEKEVPGGRRRWPESIRSRVLALGRLGVIPSKIAQLTGISRATVFLWCRNLPRYKANQRSRSEFVQLPSANPSPTVRQTSRSLTVGLNAPVEATTVPIALTTPDGFRFDFSGEGAWQFACAAYAKLRTGDPS